MHRRLAVALVCCVDLRRAHVRLRARPATFAQPGAVWWVPVSVLMVLGFAAAHLIARGIRRGVAQGDLTVEVVPSTPPIERMSSDEIGDVARSQRDPRGDCHLG